MHKTPESPAKGRGATTNRTGRFERETTEAFDDGWTPDEELPPLRTIVGVDASRTIITKNDSPDIPFDRSINPYRGCEHGCIYCFARPSHAYLGYSPGLDFETRIFCKPTAAELLTEELRHPRYRCAMIAMGTNTDPYQPTERTHRITRRILEVLASCDHPVGIVTKSALVLRDLDILAPMAAKRLASVFVSVTTLDRGLARRLEPRAATPARRLETIAALNAAGVPTGVLVAPVIPGLTDSEIERILESAQEAGARRAGYVLLRLPLEIKELFSEWLEVHVPLKAKRVLQLVRETRGGALYDATFGRRQTGTGPIAELIAKRFALTTSRRGFDTQRFTHDTSHFRPPPRSGDQLLLL